MCDTVTPLRYKRRSQRVQGWPRTAPRDRQTLDWGPRPDPWTVAVLAAKAQDPPHVRHAGMRRAALRLIGGTDT